MKAYWLDGGWRRGIGYYCYSDGKRLVRRSLGRIGGCRDAEFLAMLNFLKEVTENDITVYVDYEPIVAQITKGRLCKPTRRPSLVPVFHQIVNLITARRVRVEWIPREEIEAALGC